MPKPTEQSKFTFEELVKANENSEEIQDEVNKITKRLIGL